MTAQTPHPRFDAPSGYRPAGDWLEREGADGARTWCRRYDKAHARFARFAIVHAKAGGGWGWTVVAVARGKRTVIAEGSAAKPLPEMCRPFADLAARTAFSAPWRAKTFSKITNQNRIPA